MPRNPDQHGPAESYRVTLQAGESPRTDTVVFFELPDDGTDWRLRDGSGLEVACQIAPRREGSFVLPRLEAGHTAVYTLTRGKAAPRADVVQVARRGGVVRVACRNRAVMDFHVDRSPPPTPEISAVYGRAGYVHPLRSPSGIEVTGDFAKDNPHQHGIWFAWPNTEFEGRTPNFWDAMATDNPAQHSSAGSGRVELVALDRFWSGPVHGGFEARLRAVDQSVTPEVPAILESWIVRSYCVGDGADAYWLFDLASDQRCAGASPVGFPAHRYGGFCVRGNAQWMGSGNAASFLTADGETDRLKANTSRSRWCHIGGNVNGAFTGIAVLAHPGNFRFPEPLRVHHEVPLLNFAPSQAGAWEMTPGKSMLWRYRFLVADGRPDRERLEGFWKDFADPVRVTLDAT